MLLMAYGSPRSLDEVGPYLRDIRGGRPVGDTAVEKLRARYRVAGCPTPLLAFTRRQAAALQESVGDAYRVRVGMKHWHPFIREAVEALAADGVGHAIGLALAPHHARISIGGYEERARAALDALARPFSLEMVLFWHDRPAFVELWARAVSDALQGWNAADGRTRVLFTAHSLPARLVAEGDPYRDQLRASAESIAARAGAPDHELAFQSSSDTAEPWLGPSLAERLAAFAAEGGARAVVAPIGFVSDHLEILYDVDVEASGIAAAMGIELRRAASPNDDPLLVEALADAVRSAGMAR